jgi:Lar family restriction alleviation protein
MDRNDLLPCPFCGGAADINADSDVVYAFCINCGAMAGESQGDTDAESISLAVEGWNQRVRP